MKLNTILKSDFVGAAYLNIEDCPIARALKRSYPKKHIREFKLKIKR